MKNKNLIYILSGACLLLIAALVYVLVSAPKADITKTEEYTEEEHAKSHNKEVKLNEAQYKASAITLGSFEKKNLSEVIHANGYTKLPPQNQADVSVHMGGMVKQINVMEGQYVKAGQNMAAIESPEFTRIHENYLVSKSNLEFIEAEFDRQKTLSEENVNAKKIFQKTKADLETEKARFNSLKKQLGLLHINPSGETTSVIPVVAPISGYVTEVNIKMGSNIETGKPLFSIVDNTKMHVDLLVYEKDLFKVKPGQTVRFVLTNQNNAEIKGKIFSIGAAFENETKSVAVHADILNENKILIPGMYVNALIDVGGNQVNALPTEAVVKADGREFIFILEEHHDEKGEEAHEASYHFQRIEVKTGTNQLGFVEVTPLQTIAGDAKIVLKGAYYIQSHLLKSEGGGGHEH